MATEGDYIKHDKQKISLQKVASQSKTALIRDGG